MAGSYTSTLLSEHLFLSICTNWICACFWVKEDGDTFAKLRQKFALPVENIYFMIQPLEQEFVKIPKIGGLWNIWGTFSFLLNKWMYVNQSRVEYKFSIKGILNEFLLRIDIRYIQGSTTIQALKMFHESIFSGAHNVSLTFWTLCPIFCPLISSRLQQIFDASKGPLSHRTRKWVHITLA